jgi:hypothetical protein
MKMRDWDEGGGQPAFGHRAYWIEDILDSLDAAEIASYALSEGDGSGDDASVPRRYLVACELGILDARADADEDDNPRLASALIPWSDVRGVRVSAVTSLDDAFRHATTWSGSLGLPSVRIDDPAKPDALLELWRECLVRTQTQTQPPLAASSDE